MIKKICVLLFLTGSLLAVSKFTLNEAITIALENNKLKKISQLSLLVAKAQYEQAMSANYPSLNLNLIGNRQKSDSIFKLRGSYIADSETTKILALASTLDPNNQLTLAFGSAANAQAAIANGTVTLPATEVPLNMDVIANGRDTLIAQLELFYPIYTGGKISSIQKQAKLNELLAKITIERDEITVVHDVKKYFYAYSLSNELYKIAHSTYKSMKSLEDLTKQFLEEGDSLNIRKTDYYNMQLTVTLIESTVNAIDINKQKVKSALINVMGLPWNSEIEPIYKIADSLNNNNRVLNELVQNSYEQNIDLKKLNIGLQISDEMVNEAKAAHYPDVVFKANAMKADNSYEYSMLNEDNGESWDLTLAVKIPLFSGFKTSAEVTQKKLEEKKLLQLKEILQEGLALQLKNEFIQTSIGYKQIKSLQKAKEIASKNRSLNVRGYQVDAVKPEEVIQAQLTEAYVKAAYITYVYDYLISLSKIDMLIGKKLQ